MAVIDSVFAEEQPVMYKVRTLDNKLIEGKLYAREIRRVGKFDPRKKLTVKKVHDEQTKNGELFSLVQYNEFPPGKKFYVWVKTNDIIKD